LKDFHIVLDGLRNNFALVQGFACEADHLCHSFAQARGFAFEVLDLM
jgi:hypothetical protein